MTKTQNNNKNNNNSNNKQSIINLNSENESTLKIFIAIVVDPQFAFKLVDRGPIHESEEAKVFRNFWGEKSELRKFRDGSIIESVVWKCEKNLDRFTIIVQSVNYILNRHSPNHVKQICELGSQLTNLLAPSELLNENVPALIAEVEQLGIMLRELSTPLIITKTTCISPIIRSTDAHSFINVYSKNKNIGEKISTIKLEMIIKFEASSSWPDDIEAIRILKSAFYANIAKNLVQFNKFKTRNNIKLENLSVATFKDYIEVNWYSRIFEANKSFNNLNIFEDLKEEQPLINKHTISTRIFIHNKREIQLLHLKKSNEETRYIEAFELRPSHSIAIQQISSEFEMYSSTVRLAKRWLSCQMLSNFLSEEAIELIVAYLFVASAPMSPPHTPFCGFYRFIKLLATHNWAQLPLVVNLDGSLTEQEIQQAKDKYNSIIVKRTNSNSEMPLFIYTNYDSNSYWTSNTPNNQIFQRIILTAKATEKILSNLAHNFLTLPNYEIELENVFFPITSHFDLIINLDLKCLEIDNSINISKLYDFIRLLNVRIGDRSIIFWDSLTPGNKIGIIWKPKVFLPINHNASGAMNSIPIINQNEKSNSSRILTNIFEIINFINEIGGSLINSIQQNNDSSRLFLS
eukprot:TRINITY_DN4834_c1_g1_i2.p1 TRINITY_DN4834_c1_g1~~TRINITY_DN4834_c1_g1_i2.p1  ORF type:complete len:653 (-),score=228.81 TRINITY_DN4834_c1_g1_i2:87-1982(-)